MRIFFILVNRPLLKKERQPSSLYFMNWPTTGSATLWPWNGGMTSGSMSRLQLTFLISPFLNPKICSTLDHPGMTLSLENLAAFATTLSTQHIQFSQRSRTSKWLTQHSMVFRMIKEPPSWNRLIKSWATAASRLPSTSTSRDTNGRILNSRTLSAVSLKPSMRKLNKNSSWEQSLISNSGAIHGWRLRASITWNLSLNTIMIVLFSRSKSSNQMRRPQTTFSESSFLILLFLISSIIHMLSQMCLSMIKMSSVRSSTTSLFQSKPSCSITVIMHTPRSGMMSEPFKIYSKTSNTSMTFFNIRCCGTISSITLWMTNFPPLAISTSSSVNCRTKNRNQLFLIYSNRCNLI